MALLQPVFDGRLTYRRSRLPVTGHWLLLQFYMRRNRRAQ